MTALHDSVPDSTTALDRIWYTRCPVPTASGIAYNLGWLDEEFVADGIAVGVLQDAAPEIADRHFDHRLVGLFREGGNVPALVARSDGAPTRLIGLTWIDERQSVLVRDDTAFEGPSDLRGLRLAVPGWAEDRARSFPRAMALHGLSSALRLGDLTFDDVTLVEVEGHASRTGRWPGLDALAAGEVDAVYVKGARSAEQAREVGARTAVELDRTPDRSGRVNNGTPRPITVHEQLLQDRPDVVVRFLVRTLRAAAWASTHVDDVRTILGREVGSGAGGVVTAYGDDFHRWLAPTLDDDRLALLDQQQRFLGEHGFLAGPVDVAAWAAHEPLEAASRILADELGGEAR